MHLERARGLDLFVRSLGGNGWDADLGYMVRCAQVHVGEGRGLELSWWEGH